MSGPRPGGYRQFHQFGVEAIGSEDPALDAEVIALGYEFYREVGLPGVTVEINSVGTPAIRAAFREKLLAFLDADEGRSCARIANRAWTAIRCGCWTARSIRIEFDGRAFDSGQFGRGVRGTF